MIFGETFCKQKWPDRICDFIWESHLLAMLAIKSIPESLTSY